MPGRRDLEGWAVALGAGNDDDAGAASLKLLNELAHVHGRVQELARSLETAPSDDVRRPLANALRDLGTACTAVGLALRGFANHERGR